VLGPVAQRRRGPRPCGHTAHGHAGTTRLGLGQRSACGPAQPARAAHGGLTAAPHRRTGDDRGNGARLTGAGTVARHDGDGRAAVRRHGQDGGARGEACGRAARGVRRAGGQREAVGAADAARSGRHLSPFACVRTAPPTAANHGSARCDTATDRRAPRVNRFPNLNKSPRMKIDRRK
jgi:hypothetical protein